MCIVVTDPVLAGIYTDECEESLSLLRRLGQKRCVGPCATPEIAEAGNPVTWTSASTFEEAFSSVDGTPDL